MPQKVQNILPRFINTDIAFDKMSPTDSPFIKAIQSSINNNPDLGIGANNPAEIGQNDLVLTPVQSNIKIDGTILPIGYNKNIGSFESVTTRELYYFNKNINGNDGIYVLNGDTGIWKKVVEDIQLQFTDEQEGFIAPHRVSLRPILNQQGEIIEKILLITDGQSWQKWILVNTGIATDGFNPSLYPYFTPLPPHFDRREVLEWATRPVMPNPEAVTIPNTDADKGKVNRLIDSAFQFAVSVNYTDGRQVTLSPYSLPLIVNSTDFLNNPDNVPKNAVVTIYAGGVWVESVDIYVRECAKQDAGIPSTLTWSDWKWIDRVYKFGNDPNVLETQFWLRTNPFANNNYNSVFNTFEYSFDNSKLGLPPLIDVTMIENRLPQLSVAHTQLADAEALADNRSGYDNLSTTQLNNLDIVVKEKENKLCPVELATITVYGYVGMCDKDFTYTSQVGYIYGEDTLVRFGGLRSAVDYADSIDIDVNESNFYQLNLAGKKGFRLYAKGTPYFVDGEWIQVKSDNSIVAMPTTIDLSNNDTKQNIQTLFEAGSYMAIRWKLRVPKGRYNLAIGRHNVESSGDYRNTSTYVYGIANSRVKSSTPKIDANGNYNLITLKPNSIVTFSKEMEIDCTNGDVDVWGNNKDTFYIYCPYNHVAGNGKFRFIEGYFQEDVDEPLPVAMFPYQMNHSATDDCGQFTDKNGFYWAFTKVANANVVDIQFVAKLNCAYPINFTIATSQTGIGWMQNATAYLSDNNSGVVGACNRVVFKGKITDLTGTIGYSNVSISIVDQSTVNTDQDGNFTLIFHNGTSSYVTRNVYVNAGGNFYITIANCGQIPLSIFDESLIPCVNCTVRDYPLPLNLAINAQGGSQTSLKEGAGYSVGVGTADLAGRLSFVSGIKTLTVSSFLQRNDLLPTYFQAQINGQLKLQPDLKWATFYVSKNTSYSVYLDWVGDKIKYIDSNGNVVSDPASAVFCSIFIDSLYNTNVANNFSLLATYQFSPKDRIRILDDGDGNLLNTATYGDEINLQILGTNYNQAAQAAQIVPNPQNPIVNVSTSTTEVNTSVTLFVKYDSRLDKLINSTGFWIEIYTPIHQTDKIPYFETKWLPVINGEIAEFTGYNGAGQPQYNYPVTIDIDFWDTYLFNRNINIPDIGDKFLAHPFNSQNVSDDWGANLTSGGRENTVNPNAKQTWYIGEIIRSDNFISGGSINGLGLFRRENRTDFSFNPAGAIIAVIAQRNVVLFICTNDFFTTNYQFHFAYVNKQGVMQVNLNNDLSQPFQKIGDNFGCLPEDTGTIIFYDKFVWWYDQRNAAYIESNYAQARDISDIEDKEGNKLGIKSYLLKKSNFIGNWNNTHDKSRRFDVIAGIDLVRNNVLFTFRPRRNNSNELSSYVNQRRNWQVDYQETFTYNWTSGRWIRSEGFTPEGYGVLRGKTSGVQLYSFAGGNIYSHNNLNSNSFLNYFGIDVEPVLSSILNSDEEAVKILQNTSLDSTLAWFVDMVYDGEQNSYSYIPVNYVKKRENNFYAAFLRDMVSYFSPNDDNNFRSTLIDGKRIFGNYFYLRLIGDKTQPNLYRQLNDIFLTYTASPSNKK